MRVSVISLAIALAISVSACSEKQSVEQYIASGQTHIAAGDYASAIIEFKNAVKLDSKSAAARLALAKAYMEQGNFVFAEKELQRAMSLGLESSAVIPLLFKAQVKLNNTEDVAKLFALSDDLPDQDYIKILTYAGISALSNKQPEQALDYFAQAVSINANSDYGKLAKAYSLYSDKQYTKVFPVINSLINQHGEMAEAFLLQGHAYYASGDYEQAVKAFSLYIEDLPFDHTVKFFKAQSLIKAKQYQLANDYVAELLAVFPESPTALLYKAQIEFQHKNFAEARTFADKVFVQKSDDIFARIIAGVSSYHLNDIEQTYAHLNVVEHKFSADHPITKLLLITRFKLGYETKQNVQLNELEGFRFEDIALLDDLAKNSEMSAIKEQEAIRLANEGLSMLASDNKAGIALIENASLLTLQLSDVDLRLALEYIKLAEYDKAAEIAERFQAQEDDAHLADKIYGHIHIAKQKPELAIEKFKQSLVSKPSDIGSIYSLVQLFIHTEQYESAFMQLHDLLKFSPNHKGGLAALIELSTVADYAEKTIHYLETLPDEKTIEQIITLAQIYKHNNQLDKAQSVLKAKAENLATTPAYWLILGDNYLEQKAFNLANKAYASGLVLDNSHYILNLRYMSSFEMLNNIEQAFQVSQQLLEFYPENTRALILYAYFASQSKQVAQAKNVLTTLQEQKVQHSLLDAASGDIALYERDYAKAIESYASLYEGEANGVNAVRLARALKFNGQAQEAVALLEEYLVRQPSDVKIRLLLIELFSNEQRAEKVKHYQILHDFLPKDPLILNNLAWNQYKLGQMTQALENIGKAYKVQPENSAILASYGVILSEDKQYKQAIDYLQRAIAAGSQDKAVKDHLDSALKHLEHSQN
ncbi:XrtA/PEP-CTERM system TPR-repeat protein PrsT [Litorilituus sediminis]|nr:XrtA/PEP-CTERM system TPR-repeat protein PrsT [Litorilituus sediminis]